MLDNKSIVILATIIMLIIMLVATNANTTEVNCEYTDKTTAELVGKIDGIRNFESKTADYAEEKRVCAVGFEAKIGKKWYKTRDFYVFGPDMSQSEACNKAKDKAKIAVLEQHGPQYVTSNVEHYCEEKTPEKIVEAPVKKEKEYLSVTDMYTTPSHGADIHANRKRHDRFNNNMRLYNFVTMLYGQFVLN